MGKKAHFIGNCVGLPGGFIHKIVDNSRDITYRTLIKHVPFQELREMFSGYDWYVKDGLKIWEDYAVSFLKSQFDGRVFYVVQWSSVEHIWELK